jgi:hypothetical protein
MQEPTREQGQESLGRQPRGGAGAEGWNSPSAILVQTLASTTHTSLPHHHHGMGRQRRNQRRNAATIRLGTVIMCNASQIVRNSGSRPCTQYTVSPSAQLHLTPLLPHAVVCRSLPPSAALMTVAPNDAAPQNNIFPLD